MIGGSNVPEYPQGSPIPSAEIVEISSKHRKGVKT